MTYSDVLNFELYIMDLCEAEKPKSCKDLEKLSENLHERVEMAIQDFIIDDDNLDIDDYEPGY